MAKYSILSTYTPFQFTEMLHKQDLAQSWASSVQDRNQESWAMFCALVQGRTPSPDLKQKERDKRTAQNTAFEKPASFVMIKESITD